MHPQIKENKPGKCPICHMELNKIIQSDNKANDEISLSDEQIKLGNITTQSSSETQNSIDQKFTGVLTQNQEKIKTLSSRSMGRIEKLYVKTTGEYVEINQPVYQLYSEDIAIAKQDYYMAYKQLSFPGDFGKNAKSMLDAAKQKLLFYGLNSSQIKNLKSTNEVSPYTTFYSTFNGYVSEVITQEGSYVMEGAGIIKLANLNTLWLEIQVNANYVSSIKIGQNGTVAFTDFPSKTVISKIAFINPEINSDTRLLLIRLEVPNNNLELKPGMQATAKITKPNVKGIFIPIDAVIRAEKASYIWVEKRPGVFENIMVETGIETNGMIEIKSEIGINKKVVITGAYGINSEYIFRNGSDPMAGMKM
jgi:Cu(I)/Ag(I) efflux system membrane fusion protein